MVRVHCIIDNIATNYDCMRLRKPSKPGILVYGAKPFKANSQGCQIVMAALMRVPSQQSALPTAAYSRC